MRKVLLIAWNALSRLARDKKALVVLLLMPMVLIGILGSALGSLMNGGGIQPFPVIVVNADVPWKPVAPPDMPKAMADKIPATHLGKTFVDDVLGSEQVKELLQVKVGTDVNQAKALVADGKAIAVLYVPAIFTESAMTGKSASIVVYGDPASTTRVGIVEQIARSFAEYVNTATLAGQVLPAAQIQSFVSSMNEQLPKVTVTNSGAKEVKAIQYYAAAMAIMFMVMTAFNRAKDILTEKADGTLARILISPTSKSAMIAGQMLGNVAVILAQFGILMVGTRLIYQVDWGNWPAALTLGAAFSLAAAGIGTAAAGLFDDPRAADSATGTIGMLFAALSGSMFPLYQFPDGLKLIAKFVPNYWALQGLLDQMSGLGAGYLWLPTLILCTIGIVTGGLGAWRLAAK